MKRIIVAVSIVGGLAVAAFAYYAISPLFRNIEANEAAPQGAIGVERAPAEVRGTPAHPASGTVRIVEVDGKRYVRYENYKTINGPDIFVYLAKDLEAKEFVDLGRVRATEGNVNYEIPPNINPDEYPYVLTWCKMFGVLFNYAHLGPSATGSEKTLLVGNTISAIRQLAKVSLARNRFVIR